MSLEDIDTLFGSTAGKEDLRIKHQVCIVSSCENAFVIDSSTILPTVCFPRFLTHALVLVLFLDADRA